jgi:hypothetical protein
MLLNVQSVNNVMQIRVEIHIAEPLILGPSPSEIEITIAKLKMYKLSGSVEILVELIQVGGKTLESEIHTLINSIWNKEELPVWLKESITSRSIN